MVQITVFAIGSSLPEQNLSALSCLKISRTGSQFEHAIFKSQHDNVLRPLPIFGSGDDSYSTQWPRPRPRGKGVLLCGRAFRRRTNREAAARRRNQMLRSGLSNVGALVITPCDPMRPMGAVARAAALSSSIGGSMKLNYTITVSSYAHSAHSNARSSRLKMSVASISARSLGWPHPGQRRWPIGKLFGTK